MKKTLVGILALAMILSLVLIPAAASETAGVIANATPTVDGVLDDAYLQSYSVVTDTNEIVWVPKEHTDNDLKSTTYFLHDGQWLYIAAVVTGDSAVVDTGMNDWVADSVEIWLSDSSDLYTKVPLGAFGNALPNGAIGEFDNKLHIDFTGSEVSATQNDGGYVVEAKIPLSFYDETNTSIGINVQLNNIASADTNAGNVADSVAGFFGSQATGADPIILTLADMTAPAEPIVQKGTAVIDGTLDDAFKSSYSIVTDTSAAIWIPKEHTDNDLKAVTYFLHDGEYLYIAAVVTGDSAVVDTGLVDWVADSVEVWLSDSADLYTKVPLGAFGNALPNGAIGEFDNKLHMDFTGSEVAATQNDGGYVVEAKIPLAFYDETCTSIGVNIQLNNVASAETNGSNVAENVAGFFGTQATGADPVILTLAGIESSDDPLPTDPQPTDPEPQPTQPAPTEPQATEPQPTEPADQDSADPTLAIVIGVIVAVAVIAVVVVVVLRKKKA